MWEILLLQPVSMIWILSALYWTRWFTWDSGRTSFKNMSVNKRFSKKKKNTVLKIFIILLGGSGPTHLRSRGYILPFHLTHLENIVEKCHKRAKVEYRDRILEYRTANQLCPHQNRNFCPISWLGQWSIA